MPVQPPGPDFGMWWARVAHAGPEFGRPVSRPVFPRARRGRRSAIVSSIGYSGETMKSKVTGALLAAGITLAIPGTTAVSAFASARTCGSGSVKGIIMTSRGGEAGA